MNSEQDDFWATVPKKAIHPLRVPILEAFRWIGEPLSPIALVDVLDGFVSMWDAARQLRVLQGLGVVEPLALDTPEETAKHGLFDQPSRLTVGPVQG